MKQRTRSLISCVLFFALLICSISLCSEFLEHKEARIKYDAFFNAETNYDVIFLGTSHTYNSLLPMEMWREYGISSYNWGYPNCTLAVTYHLIPEIAKYTSPKLLVLDLYGLLEYENNPNGKYRPDVLEQYRVQFDELPFSINKVKAALDIFDDYSTPLDFVWNLPVYHNRWTELSQKDFNPALSVQKGSSFRVGWKYNTYTPIQETEPLQIDTVCYSYLIRILEYCQEQNLPLLCVYLPYPAPPQVQQLANTIGETIEAYDGCHYLNPLDSGIADYRFDLIDNDHLNFAGSCKVTSWLGGYIAQHYPLDDYSGNGHWQHAYQEYIRFLGNALKSQQTLVNHLLMLYNSPYQCTLEICSAALAECQLLFDFAENSGVQIIVNIQDVPEAAKLTVISGNDVFLERSFYIHGESGDGLMQISCIK